MKELKVSTHSGEEILVEVESYNSVEMTDQLNDGEISAIELGGVVFSRIDVKMILPMPIKEEAPEELPEDDSDIPLTPIEPPVESESENIPLTPLEPSEEVDEPTNIPEHGEVNIPELES